MINWRVYLTRFFPWLKNNHLSVIIHIAFHDKKQFSMYFCVQLRMAKQLKNISFYLILMFLLVGSGVELSAQIIKGEAILGMNLTQVDGDEVYGFKKVGANIGAGVMVPFGKRGRWDVSFETIFTQKGSKQGPQYNDSLNDGRVITGEYKLNLNYVEVPVLVMYTDKEFISFGAGLSWARLVGVKEYEHGQLVETTTVNSGTYSKNDFSILADFRIRIYKSLKFNLRYQYSLLKIRTREFENFAGDTWTRDQYNNVITFRLIWVFNEAQSRKNFVNTPSQ